MSDLAGEFMEKLQARDDAREAFKRSKDELRKFLRANPEFVELWDNYLHHWSLGPRGWLAEHAAKFAHVAGLVEYHRELNKPARPRLSIVGRQVP